MGTLIYANNLQFEIEDRTLEQLKTVVFTKLRKQESFSLTVRHLGGGDASEGDAADTVASDSTTSTALWVSPDIPLGFRISRGIKESENSDEQLAELMRLSYSKSGLTVEAMRAD